MPALLLALRDSRRDLRLLDVRLLLLALMVAVTAVTSVSFFTDRVDRAMRQQATALLGADLVMQSSRPVPPDYVTAAEQAGLQTALTVEFPSVAFAAEQSVLAQVKAVSAAYPLRGQLETASQRGDAGRAAAAPLQPGDVWVEDRVLLQLGVQPGDRLSLGNRDFTIARIITFEPDRSGAVFQLAPRIMMHRDDLDATGLITPASRASFQLLLAGDAADIEQQREQLTAALQPYERIQTIADGRPEISGALLRATRFMTLASMLTVVLAGAAIALAAQGFCRREINRVAIVRTLGASRRQLWLNYSVRLLTLLLIASIMGSLLGALSQQVLGHILSQWLQVALPAAGFAPLLTGFGTAALTLAGFALPPVLQLLQTPPMQILRNEPPAAGTRLWLSLLSMAVALMLLLAWQAGDWTLALYTFAGITAALSLMIGLSWSALTLLRRMRFSAASGYRQGLVNLARYRQRATLLIATFATATLALTLLGSVRQDLMRAWQSNVPENAPNYFLINIQPQELTPLDTFLRQRQLDNYTLYPMVRGRLLSINGAAVSADNYNDDRARRLVSREFNLSAASSLPDANEIIEGNWFLDDSDTGLSVEADIAETVGFKLGDTLEFDIAGQTLSETITSVRSVDWDTMQPNFFVMTAPQQLAQFPATWITSVHVPPGDNGFTTDLVKAFPGVTTLDVQAILTQVRRIMDQASSAVSYVFLFTLLAGSVVLIAAIQTQRSARKQEIALLKSMGATEAQLRRSVVVEFAAIGLLSGVLGSLLAVATGWSLAWFVFDLSYGVNLLQPLLITLVCVALVGSIGWWVVRSMLKTSPMALLRDA